MTTKTTGSPADAIGKKAPAKKAPAKKPATNNAVKPVTEVAPAAAKVSPKATNSADVDRDTVVEAVNAYLEYCQDPSTIVNTEAIAAAEAELESATTPLETLKARGALNRAKQVDATEVTAGFITHAAAFAEAEDLTAKDFKGLGVTPKVLREAGLTNQSTQRTRGSAKSVADAISTLTGTWTLKQLAEAGGASTGTADRVLKEALENKAVTEVGPDPDHNRRGKAPTLYTTA